MTMRTKGSLSQETESELENSNGDQRETKDYCFHEHFPEDHLENISEKTTRRALTSGISNEPYSSKGKWRRRQRGRGVGIRRHSAPRQC